MATDNDCVQYWTHMKDRAAMHISTVTERTDPETEAELKDRVALAFRSGRPREVAEAVVEAMEWMTAHLMLHKHEHMKALDHAAQ